MRDDYTRAYRLLRQARRNLKWCPKHLTFWGRRILRFERANRRQALAMAKAANSLQMIIEGGVIRNAP